LLKSDILARLTIRVAADDLAEGAGDLSDDLSDDLDGLADDSTDDSNEFVEKCVCSDITSKRGDFLTTGTLIKGDDLRLDGIVFVDMILDLDD
jgi:hypothetical protein